jgi:CheY-like chemotaxis protein
LRVLLVEDDGMIAQGLQTALRQSNYAVDWVADGKSADAALQDSVFDLVLLDLGLPQRDGLDVLRAMRRRGSTTPVIILTARDEIQQRIAGLDAGADDYIVKPFDLDEVMARMRSVLRRAAGRGDPVIQHGDLRLDPVSHTVERNGAPVSLSASFRSSKRCCSVRARCCRAASSKIGYTDGTIKSAAMRSKSTSTGCGASSAATSFAHCAASVISFPSHEVHSRPALDRIDSIRGIGLAARRHGHVPPCIERDVDAL